MSGTLKRSGEKVSVSSYRGLCLDSLQVTLPNGETFVGYINVPESDAQEDSFCVPRFQKVASSAAVVSDGQGYDSMLSGDRLDTMRCDMDFQETRWWWPPSGTGVCTLPDSRIIEIQ
jgi:hypothetical protein